MTKKPQTPSKGNWRVTIRCTVTKDVYCEDCTEEQAKNDPWSYAKNEQEIDQQDWKVMKVEPSE